MRGSRPLIGTALAAGALAAGALVFAPAAAAVTPGTAQAGYDCGSWGGGAATLAATQNGTSATITITSAVTTPIAVARDTINATLTLAKAGGGTVKFTGRKNPALPAGGAVRIGPLTGTVTSGASLNSFFAGPALTMNVLGFPVNCDAVTSQTPGPFVYS
ncbi:hypothetical protein [Streptomyces clavuligerus]|uniref:Secreted protein n=1 Tax=Streptomyces clavuligerus TaxID=1901 RepID=E2Q335_STRCL|nr:hypothetical protein [Streptomyces clavuligerus]ANW20278.1 hypothetical protein BB341_19715 [Streptomyces clavuligerus]AXU14904.1 hypothetical protein D1794_20535 [Streptomyces clavuligerus]EFG06788.1 Hypothetical protein SCLAV_1713 [Streptomyces clavuligerus]MBY6304946.1 hypothetical protein [Streptomyces clavuligerus]QCS07676.1 hypothetical protein CRV15_19900 [Streptomyces clavuligerus]